MFLRSVDIRGHFNNVLTVNWSIVKHLKKKQDRKYEFAKVRILLKK